MKIPFFGKLKRKQSMAIGVALAVVALLVVSPMIMGDPMTESFEGSTEMSAVSGNFKAYAEVRDSAGNALWSSADGSNILGQSIVDPSTGKIAETCAMGVSWTATGSELDWNTMRVWGRFWFWSYSGNGGGKDYMAVRDDGEILFPVMSIDNETGKVTGALEFTPTHLDSDMPDTIIMIFREKEFNLDGTWTTSTWTEEYPQKTTASHSMKFVYKAMYWVEVNDIYGNPFSGEYTQWTTLNLQWAGSEFNIDWGGEATIDTATSISPTIDALVDQSAPEGTPYTITWHPRDGDNNPDRYEIHVDGVLKASGLWGGGDIPYTSKYAAGPHEVTCTVYDKAGAYAEDIINLAVYSEIDDGLEQQYPDSPTSATSDFEEGITDYVDRTDTFAMSGLGGVFGSQQGLLILAGVSLGGLLLYKTGGLKVITKKIKKRLP